ncbi:hypothetical protein Q9L58_009810 [Maublancomyces gigas]|uniref:Uncharacterized protein n=1 Tax=Discina gigas TaxID=1032678 RepID=A0ABR3G6X5_9PEZI
MPPTLDSALAADPRVDNGAANLSSNDDDSVIPSCAYRTFPPVTLSKSIIPPTEAAVLCETIGAMQLLIDLNRLSNCKKAQNMHDPGVEKAIQWCLSSKFDFGVAYGRLRQIWTFPNVGNAWKIAVAEEKAIEKSRDTAFSIDKRGRRTLLQP